MKNSYFINTLFTFFAISLISCGGSGEKKEATQINRAPKITLTAPTTAISGDIVSLSAKIIDPENQPTSVEWSIVKGDGITLSSTENNDITFSVPLTTTTLQIELAIKATDTQGLSSNKTLTIDVPAAVITLSSDDSFQVLKTATVTADIQTINLSAFTTTWSLNDLALNNQEENSYSYQPTFSQQGAELHFGLVVSDDAGKSLSATFKKTVPTVSVSFDVPYEPISLRYVHVNAQFENLDPNDVNLQWQVTNAEELTLEKADTANLQFFAKEQLLNRQPQYFRPEQQVDLSLTLSHLGETLEVYNTSLTIKDVEQLPIWPKHEISQLKAKKVHNIANKSPATLNSQRELNCTNDPDFNSNKIKTIDFNIDGFADFFCVTEQDQLHYYQSLTKVTFKPAVTLLADTNIGSTILRSIKFFDINNNGYPEVFIPHRLTIDESSQPPTFRYQFEQFEFNSTSNAIVKTHVFSTPILTQLRQIYFSYIDGSLYFASEYQNETLINNTADFTLDIRKLDITNGAITNDKLVDTLICNGWCYSFSLIKTDLNNDGIDELIFSSFLGGYGNPNKEFIRVSTDFGESFSASSICISITRRNTNSDDFLEWVCTKGHWYETSKWELTVIDGKYQKQLIIDYEADLFFNYIFNTTIQDINNDGAADEVSFTVDFRVDFYTHMYGNYTFYRLANSTQKILLTRHSACDFCYGEAGLDDGLAASLVGMDADGDLDLLIKKDEQNDYWLENTESLPITEAVIE